MKRSVGGRGYKLPFENRTVRMPEPLMGRAVEMIEEFYENDFEVPKPAVAFDDALEEAKQVLKQKKGAKTSVEKLLKRLYDVDSVDLSG